MGKTDRQVSASDIAAKLSPALQKIEEYYGIEGLDQVLAIVEERRKTLLYDAQKERDWAPE